MRTQALNEPGRLRQHFECVVFESDLLALLKALTPISESSFSFKIRHLFRLCTLRSISLQNRIQSDEAMAKGYFIAATLMILQGLVFCFGEYTFY